MMSPIRELQADELCVSCNVGAFDFETTAELEPGTSIIGQPRGVRAIEFGLRMASPGYNVYVLGESGTGRTTAIQRFIESQAATAPIPDDWVYVHNFIQPHKPVALRLPAGLGCEFRNALRNFISHLRGEIAGAFDNREFRDAALEVEHQLEARQTARIEALQAQAAEQGAAIASTGQGFQIVPARDGQPVGRNGLESLSQEEREACTGDVMHASASVANRIDFLSQPNSNSLVTKSFPYPSRLSCILNVVWNERGMTIRSKQ